MNAVDPQSRVIAPPRRRRVQRFAAWVLIVFGVIFLTAGLFNAPENAEDAKNNKAATVMGLVLLLPGIAWLWMARRNDGSTQSVYEEKAILAVAAKYGGRATVAQIALETQLSMDQAESAINRLCGKNVAQPDLMDDGSVVYQFGMLA